MSNQDGEAGRLVDYAVVREPKLGRLGRPELVGLAQQVIEEAASALGPWVPGDVVTLSGGRVGVVLSPMLGVSWVLPVPSSLPGGVPPLMLREGAYEDPDTDESDYFDDPEQAWESWFLQVFDMPPLSEARGVVRGADALAAREEAEQLVRDSLARAESLDMRLWTLTLRNILNALPSVPPALPAPAATVGLAADDDWWDEDAPVQVYVPPQPDVPKAVASFTIPTERVPEVVKALEKLTARGEKQGIQIGVSMQPGEPYYHKDDPERANPIDTTIVTVVEPERPEVKGWELLAVVEHGRDDEGRAVNVVLRDPTSPYKVPVKYRNEESYCDHCKTRRRRNQTWLLVKTAGMVPGQPIEVVRVGAQCLKDYVEPVSAKALLAVYDLYAEIKEYVTGASGWLDEERGINGARRHPYNEFLAYVAADIAEHGWQPRWIKVGGEPRRNTVTATADAAWIAMTGHQFMPGRVQEYLGEADMAVEWARQIPYDTPDDYLSNLRASVFMGGVSEKALGVLASLIPAYRRATSQSAGDAVQPHAFFLKVGDKFNATYGKKGSKAVAGPVRGVVTFTSAGGYSGMSEVYAPPHDGHAGAYFWLWQDLSKEGMGVGTEVLVSGNVKQHSDYKGKQRTTLNYATVIPA